MGFEVDYQIWESVYYSSIDWKRNVLSAVDHSDFVAIQELAISFVNVMVQFDLLLPFDEESLDFIIDRKSVQHIVDHQTVCIFIFLQNINQDLDELSVARYNVF